MIQPFRVVAADCPWLFGDSLPGETRGASRQYDCMSTWDIQRLGRYEGKQLYVADQPIARDAALFLWEISTMPQEALDVVRSWGFKVKTRGIWLKKTVNGERWFGMGRTLRAEHESFLVCTRGTPAVLNHSIRSTFVTEIDFAGLSAEVGRHSEKPEKFYEIVEQLFEGPRLELFARRQRAGWTCLGDES